jgi:hypothetical protein
MKRETRDNVETDGEPVHLGSEPANAHMRWARLGTHVGNHAKKQGRV